MTEYEYNAMRKRHCESVVQQHFHLHLPVEEMLFDDVETGADSYAVLFRSGRHLYTLFVDEQQRQTLGDVKSMMRSMGVKRYVSSVPHWQTAFEYRFKRIQVS